VIIITHVVAVSSFAQRDILIANMRINIEANKQKVPERLEVIQDRQNRLKIYHIIDPEHKVCIKTVIIIVVQVLINLEPLKEIYDDTVIYDLEEIFTELEKWKKKLYNVKNINAQKRRDDGKKFTRLVESLSDLAS
jgi:hypothetical protein